jgi:hypothetical protein
MNRANSGANSAFPVTWGRSVLEPARGHVRESQDGHPVILDFEGSILGMALCGALLIDDLDPDVAAADFDKCSVCMVRLDEIRRDEAGRS